eukprot:COSAG06_NODE_2199_length_7365_cov_4.321222_9_plen_130_part_00
MIKQQTIAAIASLLSNDMNLDLQVRQQQRPSFFLPNPLTKKLTICQDRLGTDRSNASSSQERACAALANILSNCSLDASGLVHLDDDELAGVHIYTCTCTYTGTCTAVRALRYVRSLSAGFDCWGRLSE